MYAPSSRSSGVSPLRARGRLFLPALLASALLLTGCVAPQRPAPTVAPSPSGSPSASPSAPSETAAPGGEAEPGESAAPPAGELPAATQRVEFRVTGQQSSALVRSARISDSSGGSSGEPVQRNLPWSQGYDVSVPGEGEFRKYVLWAKNWRSGTGSLTCEITVDGVVVASETSTGREPVDCVSVSGE